MIGSFVERLGLSPVGLIVGRLGSQVTPHGDPLKSASVSVLP